MIAVSRSPITLRKNGNASFGQERSNFSRTLGSTGSRASPQRENSHYGGKSESSLAATDELGTVVAIADTASGISLLLPFFASSNRGAVDRIFKWQEERHVRDPLHAKIHVVPRRKNGGSLHSLLS